MPGTFDGLPTHPMLVHAAVMLGPIVALLLLCYIAVPNWRAGLRWPTALLAVGAAISGFAAAETGEYLEHHLEAAGAPHDLIEKHAEAGDLAAISLYVIAAVALLCVFVLARVGKGSSIPALVLAILASGFVGYGVFNAGHTGATAVWDGKVSTSSTGGGDVDED